MDPRPRKTLGAAAVVASVASPVLLRRPRGLRFVALMSTAVTVSLSVAHALERPGRLRLPIEQWRRDTHQVYRPWFGRAGHAEGVALLALPAVAATDREANGPLAVAWLLMLVTYPGLFLPLVAPTNRATLASPHTPPDDAETLRGRWELGHLLRFACHGIAFGLLAWRATGVRR